MKIEQIRNDMEKFIQELSMEYYLQGAGIKQEIKINEIYKKYSGLFSSENLNEIKSALSASYAGSDEQRKLKLFLEAFYCEIIAEANKELQTEYFMAESSQAEVEKGKFMSYRSSMVHMLNETNRTKRGLIRNAIEGFVSQRLNPILEEMFRKEQEQIQNTGFKNKIEMFRELSGIDIYAIDDIMQEFIDETEKIYSENLEKLANEKLGLRSTDLYRDDMLHIMRAHQFDSHFPAGEMFTKVSSFVKNMGIDISAGNNIRFDLDARDNKSPRAFCSPVKIPGEVYLVIYPRGGAEDYTAFLHELGHALHFANISSSLPFEFKWYGDNSVTEAYAMTFDHMTLKESWMNEYLGLNTVNNREYFVHRAMNELIMIRRLAAKVHYEIKLNETSGLEGKKEMYSEILGKVLKINYSPENYLIDVDNYFYCVRYLRAWMLQANIHNYMHKSYGEKWFLDKQAGEKIQSLWSLGQKFNAEELAEMNGGYGLSIKPLVDNIYSLINNNY